MPAVSKAQRRFMGMIEHNPAMAKAKGISISVAKEFASTKDAGLPEHVQHSEAQFRSRDSHKKHPHANVREITR